MSIEVGTNTYITVAAAGTYFALAIHASAWSSASNTEKEQSLATATRSLDRQKWLGDKYEDAPTQLLEFPRSGLIDKNGDAVDETTVPQEILDATCEYALGLLNNPALQNDSNTDSNIKKLVAGSAEIEYIRGTSGPRFPTILNELIGIWLTSAFNYSGPFISGADNETSFSGDFGLTRGY